MIRVTENFRKIQDLLAKAAADAGRSPDAIRLLAVSKKKPAEAILEACAAGQREFGENYVQEGLEKIAKVDRDDVIWHFIGALQANKTRAIAGNFQWVHTIDRFKIARRLSEQRPDDTPPLEVLIEVNIDEEESKSGIMPVAVTDLAAAVVELPRLKLRGLMCMPAIRTDFEEQRRPFARLRGILESLNDSGLSLDTLSMGMTDDYRAAILEGATIVRIGTAIFGPR